MFCSVQLWWNLFSRHCVFVFGVCLCVCVGYQGCVSGMLELSTHTVSCSSWQIKMNSVVFGSGSPFIIFHFAQRASQTSAAACHVKTLYQGPTAPPTHTHTHTVLHMWRTYVVICLTTTPRSTTICSLCSCSFPSPQVSYLIWHQISLPALLFFA